MGSVECNNNKLMIKLIKIFKMLREAFFSLYNFISKLFKRSGGAANAVNRVNTKIEQVH
jgi:hypothetical protein